MMRSGTQKRAGAPAMGQGTRTLGALLIGTALLAATAPVFAQPPVSPAEARAIAREAYVYGYPIVESYRIEYAYFEHAGTPIFRAPWNHIHNETRVAGPEDRTVQAANTDTAYSELGLDLRTEPMVLSVPAVEGKRYFSVQLIDSYTYNFASIGSRTTGNGGGSFLVAGPDWKGEAPKGITGVIRADTSLVSVYYRTQLLDAGDWDNVKKVQAGYKVQPLSAFLGQAAPPAAAKIDFPAPLKPGRENTSLEFFRLLNFKLQFGPVDPSEKALMARFARIDVGPGLNFDAARFPPEVRKAIQAGMSDAWAAHDALKPRIDSGELGDAVWFGTREHLAGNYLYRMAGAYLGIYGLSKEEAMYPKYFVDAQGRDFDGSHRYKLRFAPGRLPPANAFWSITLYDLPDRQLYANPLKRYVINSPMLPGLERDADGGLTLYVQHASPGKAHEANWLPAPEGAFFLNMRIYWPKPEALDGRWKQPPVERVD